MIVINAILESFSSLPWFTHLMCSPLPEQHRRPALYRQPLEHRPEAALYALSLDPVTSSICTLDAIRDLFEELRGSDALACRVDEFTKKWIHWRKSGDWIWRKTSNWLLPTPQRTNWTPVILCNCRIKSAWPKNNNCLSKRLYAWGIETTWSYRIPHLKWEVSVC